jgi:hypothetical protein
MMPAMQMPMNPMSSGMMPMMGGNMMPGMMGMWTKTHQSGVPAGYDGSAATG